jgi:hypothetical protein
MPRWSLSLFATTCAALVACVTSAAAATITTDRACYHPTEFIHATVSGFPAGELVDITGDEQPLLGRYGDEGRTGDGTTDVQVPQLADRAQKTLAIKAQVSLANPDGLNTFVTATTTVQVIESTLLRLSPANGAPAAKVRLTVTGATTLAPLFLHITGRDSRTARVVSRRTIALGTPKGPCGTMKTTFRQVGTLHPRRGTLYDRTVDEVKGGDRNPDSPRVHESLPTVIVQPKATKRRGGITPLTSPVGTS